MEHLGKICVLCCQYPSTSVAPPPTTSCSSQEKVFGEFKTLFRELTQVSTSRHSSSSLSCGRGQSEKKIGTGENDVVNVDLFCLSCQTLLFPAAELHEKAMETEVRVGKLQRKILKELRNLQRQLLQFSEEMEKFREMIEREFPAEDGWPNADFRHKLFGVVRELQLFNTQLSAKVFLPNRIESEIEEKCFSDRTPESEVHGHGPIVKEEFQFLNSQDSPPDPDHFDFDFDDPDNYQSGFNFDSADPEPIDVKPKIRIPDSGDSKGVDVAKSRRGQKLKQHLVQRPDFHAESDDNYDFEEDEQSEDDVNSRKRGRKTRSRRLRSRVTATATTKTAKKNIDASEMKQEKRKTAARKLPVAPGTEGMLPFKKSVISRIISSQGVTFLSPPKRPILLLPFQQNPMKYDPETDIVSVAKSPVIIHESEKSLECSSCSLKFQNGKSKPGVEFQVHEHILGHHLQTLRCHICDKVMTTFGGLQVHLRGHQEQVPCDICGRPFAEKRKMLRHKMTHQNASERAEASARGEGRGFEGYLGVIKKKCNFPSEIISNLKEVIDKGEVPEWKRKMICRVIRESSKQKEVIDHEQAGPLAKFPMVYDPKTDKLCVSGQRS